MASVVWDFFKVSEENSSLAICNKCNGEIPRGGKNTSSYNTSNLISHLKHRHRYDGVLKAYEDAQVVKLAANPKPAAKQPGGNVSINEAFEKTKKWNKNDPRAQAISNLIMEMMALDNQPFSIVKDVGFVRVINHLEPRYTIPGRKHFSETRLPAKYEEIATILHTMIDKDAQHVSFTTLFLYHESDAAVMPKGNTTCLMDQEIKYFI